MPKNFKLNRKGFIGLETISITLMMLLVILLVSVFVFEQYMFLIRLNEVKNAATVACERIQLDLSTEEASEAKADLNSIYESMLLEELRMQIGKQVRLIESIWFEDGLCPLGGKKDDAILHIIVAFEHQPSFLVEKLREATGHSVYEFKIHLDREIEMDI